MNEVSVVFSINAAFIHYVNSYLYPSDLLVMKMSVLYILHSHTIGAENIMQDYFIQSMLSVN